MDRNLAIELVRVSEFAALAASKHIGRGNEKAADQAAVDAMRKCLNSLTISGTVVIGEGERDEAPMLYIGEEVGAGGPQLDIALDPLEGTAITANGGENAMAVIALAQKGGFLNAPDVYMKKISANTQNQKIISLQQDLKSNIKELAQFKKVNIEDLVICILNRERHIEDIEVIRSSGARIKMIDDGDVSAVIASVINSSNIDMYYGIGGAPEGVLAAAALQCLGGSIEGQLIFYNDQEILRAKKTGIDDLDKFYSLDDLAHGDIMFSATGVTDGTMLKGIKITKNYAETHSIVMRSKTGTIRHINGEHNFLIKKLDY
ncbi:MAG: class II fructose-bisphosphatase [Alphaproteobacteria bacterium]|nr:class II fructose-bisphosphatase [Alphaproteobacteria bacterium]